MPESDDKLAEPADDGQSQEHQQETPPDAPSHSKSQPQSQPQIVPISHSSRRAATAPIHGISSTHNLSPKSSRDTSPIRPSPLKLAQNVPRLSKSRNNSQDLSPHRTGNSAGHTLPETPSSAAIQRALSAAPRLSASVNGEATLEPQKSQRTSRAITGGSQTSANNSVRITSPPNTTSSGRSTTNLRKIEQEQQTPPAPRIVVDDVAGKPTSNFESIAEEEDDHSIPNETKSPNRSKTTTGVLEAVQESSLPETPAIGAGGPLQNGKVWSSRSSIHDSSSMKDVASKASGGLPESGSESGGNKSTTASRKEPGKLQKGPSAAKAAPSRPNSSFTQLPGTKNKPTAEGSAKNMLVETETVTSIANSGIGGPGQRESSGKMDGGNTLRLKPSSETIRPKKDKKKVVRKAPSIHSGTGGYLRSYYHNHHAQSRPSSPAVKSSEFPYTPYLLQNDTLRPCRVASLSLPTEFDASEHSQNSIIYANNALTRSRMRKASSKADIFEAKVASAVDEADSSDSEETFVYESNPPEARPHRYHSRTPSAASTASQADPYGGRFRSDGNNSIVGKKSMKFANSSHHFGSHHADADNGSQSGTIGSGRGTQANSNHSHYHIGRHGRAGGHTSLFDSDSPFTNASNKSLHNARHGKTSSRPNSPRSPYTPRAITNAKAQRAAFSIEDEVADDERTPLVGNARNSRTRNSRRPAQYDDYDVFQPQGTLRGLFGYLLIGFLVISLAIAVVLAFLLCSKTLTEVRVRDISNVIASEEEIVFDLHVHAVNPNIVAVQVTNLDIKIFAKSKYVGSSKVADDQLAIDTALSKNPRSSMGTLGGIDKGTDPIEEPIGGDTMLLGRVYVLDSPLNFDPSPAKHHVSSDSGEVSLAYPGNTTADEGSDRWKTVVQHTFELIVVGQLKYTLPISSRIHLVSMGQAKTSVDPNGPVSHKTIDVRLEADVDPVAGIHNIRRRMLAFQS
jgi:hypothetical protein